MLIILNLSSNRSPPNTRNTIFTITCSFGDTILLILFIWEASITILFLHISCATHALLSWEMMMESFEHGLVTKCYFGFVPILTWQHKGQAKFRDPFVWETGTFGKTACVTLQNCIYEETYIIDIILTLYSFGRGKMLENASTFSVLCLMSGDVSPPT